MVKRTYEGLFLVDSAEAAADWNKVTGAIEKILSRSEAEVVSLRKWDDRRLAYDINKKSRGTYILAYFNCDPDRIGSMERDVQLSEKVIRVLILRTDRMTAEMMDKLTPAMVESAAAEARAAEAAAAAEAKAAEVAAAAEAKTAEEEAKAAEVEAGPAESEDTKPEDSPPAESDDVKPEDSSPEVSADEAPGDFESAESVESVEPGEPEAAEGSDDKE